VSPLGLGRLTFPGEPLAWCGDWARRWLPHSDGAAADRVLESLADELNAYLEGRRLEFAIPMDLRGTRFQLEVWRALLQIPRGETRTYGEVARAIGRPKAVRAVGSANGANPIPILVPCHRVIGSNGSLTGYGGGLELKRRLLSLEGVDHPAHRMRDVGAMLPVP
jgi:O-6-methylguanine DNA methyltransferase